MGKFISFFVIFFSYNCLWKSLSKLDWKFNHYHLLDPVALEIIFHMGFLIVFVVKSPIIPFTWLLDTSNEAYYNTCMVLAEILQNLEHTGWVKLIWNYCLPPILYFLPLINAFWFSSNNLCNFNIHWST